MLLVGILFDRGRRTVSTSEAAKAIPLPDYPLLLTTRGFRDI